MECSGACRDLQSDRLHCGTCDNACGDGEVCSGGECAVSCGGGLTECSGICRDLQSDRLHCGTCGHACEDGEVCSGGECAVSCGGGLTECSGICRDLQSDRLHCGTCGNACDDGEVCVDGGCAPSCGAGLTVCDAMCVDTGSDPNHCGGCDVTCEVHEACVEGGCTLTYPPSLVVGEPVDGPYFGGSGSSRIRPCAPGYALFGFSGKIGTKDGDRRVGRLSPICAPLEIVAGAHGFEVHTGAPVALEDFGKGDKDPWSDACPADEVILGIFGAAGGEIESLGFTCGPLVVTGAPGAWGLTVGPSDYTSPVRGGGDPAGSHGFSYDCPAGWAGTRITAQAEDRVKGIQLDCSPITLSSPSL
jgi:hypothetical protein